MDAEKLAKLSARVDQLQGQQVALQEVLASVILAHPNRSDVADLLRQAHGTRPAGQAFSRELGEEVTNSLRARKGYTEAWAALYEVASRGFPNPGQA